MSERALGFVEEWVSANIHAQDEPADGNDPRAKAYASQCIAAAQAQDIPEYEIQEAIEDLAAFMAAAIEEANEREGGDAPDDDEGDAADTDGSNDGKPSPD